MSSSNPNPLMSPNHKLLTPARLVYTFKHARSALRHYASAPSIAPRDAGKRVKETKKLGNFIDSATVLIKSGDGGRGAKSFEPSSTGDVSRARPSGGNGGPGGSVYAQVSTSLPKNLAHLASQLRAGQGGKGGPNKCYGAAGKDLVILLPNGTSIYKQQSSSSSDPLGFDASSDPGPQESLTDETWTLVAEIDTLNKAPVLLEAGGRPGRGNAGKWMDLDPEFYDGEKTRPARYFFTLSLFADCGFVGFPNAGKSSILNALTRARSLVAPYPFTTLQPHIGVLEYQKDAFQIYLADVPGIIEDAHLDKGLGIDFLRHVSRSNILAFVLDMSGADQRDPVEDLHVLQSEIRHYDPAMLERPALIIANKMDLPAARRNLFRLRKHTKLSIIEFSAETKLNIDLLKTRIRDLVENA